MTTDQLQIQALKEWTGSSGIRQQFHTFPHYWREKYQRVYGLDNRLTGSRLRQQLESHLKTWAGGTSSTLRVITN
ncbi:MAG: hypothetical protein PVG89_06680 [Gammaproteobacteria bacterium]|jgi:hypothetical protein